MTVVLNPEGKIETQLTHGDQEGLPEKDSYAIIGTREPDEAQAEVAFRLAWAIAILGGQIVRTGGAYGIDQKAMEGTQGRNLEVYLPWASYNQVIVPNTARRIVYDPKVHTSWTDSVGLYHPNAVRLSRSILSLHARNFGIVHGVRTVIALPSEDGGGGTGQGIRIARALRIPVIQANRGTINDAPRFIGRALQQLGFASSNLAVTIPNL